MAPIATEEAREAVSLSPREGGRGIEGEGGGPARIERIGVAAYTVPTDAPESDGTLEWDATTIVVVEAEAAGATGLAYGYADLATARLVAETLRGAVLGADAMGVGAAWEAMVRATRSLGRPGVVSMAIAAVDNALWDLKARLLEVSLVDLLGPVRDAVPVYGSGGFTSYSPERLAEQLGGWAAQGIGKVKMKVGRRPEDDPGRVRLARRAIGPAVGLMVDANGAYSRKRALALAETFAAEGVTWFEEPVSSDDLEGLRLLRDRAPAGLEVTAGEYGYDAFYFRRMLEAGAVDVLQADATRCAGISGLLGAAELCRAAGLPLSAHTAPTLHAHPGCALEVLRDVEYFHDHVRIEGRFFDGALAADGGRLRPDRSRPGMGLVLKRADVEEYLRYRDDGR